MKRWQLFLPLALFLGLCILLYAGLFRNEIGTLPSPLVNKPLPEFNLTTVLDENKIVTKKDLLGEVGLLNVWATWCVACRIEHPFLVKLASEGVTIYGVNYNDEISESQQWLTELHNPYRFSINDSHGTLGIDLGVYGAPETYLIDSHGIIRYKHVGIIDEKVWSDVLKSRYDELLASEKVEK